MRAALLLLTIPITGCSLESNQTAADCEEALSAPTMAHVKAIPSSGVLKRDARSGEIEETGLIAHELWGDKRKFPPLARLLEARGFKTSVVAEEFGHHLRIDEPVESFRSHAARRIKQLCQVGDDLNLRYSGWRIYAGPHTDHVMQ